MEVLTAQQPGLILITVPLSSGSRNLQRALDEPLGVPLSSVLGACADAFSCAGNLLKSPSSLLRRRQLLYHTAKALGRLRASVNPVVKQPKGKKAKEQAVAEPAVTAGPQIEVSLLDAEGNAVDEARRGS